MSRLTVPMTFTLTDTAQRDIAHFLGRPLASPAAIRRWIRQALRGALEEAHVERTVCENDQRATGRPCQAMAP